MSRTYRSSRPDAWVSPRPHTDASLRRHAYGPVQPMDYAQPGDGTRKALGLVLCVVSAGAMVAIVWGVW